MFALSKSDQPCSVGHTALDLVARKELDLLGKAGCVSGVLVLLLWRAVS